MSSPQEGGISRVNPPLITGVIRRSVPEMAIDTTMFDFQWFCNPYLLLVLVHVLVCEYFNSNSTQESQLVSDSIYTPKQVTYPLPDLKKWIM